MLGWAYETLFALGWSGGAILLHPAVFILLFGYVYLLLSLFVCFKNPSIKTLSIICVVLNLPLAALFIYWASHIQDYLAPQHFVPLAYILVWTFLTITRWFVDNRISALGQAVAITLVAAVLLLVASTVWPLTIDHESEARRFMQAAAGSNLAEARANFSEALQHATRIRDQFQRSVFLRQIVIAQADRRLYDDSTETIETYLADLHQRDKEELLLSIVRKQISNKDYGTAIATAKNLNSYAVLQIQDLGSEAVSQAKQGKVEEARQILATAITLANSQEVASTQTTQFMHIAEAQAKIGWHDGAMDSARRAGTGRTFAILGSIGANEAETGNKESARQTIQVIHETFEIAVNKCLHHGTVEVRDRCLSKLVIELGDDRFFYLARSAAGKITSISERDLASRKIAEFAAKYLNRDLEGIIKQ